MATLFLVLLLAYSTLLQNQVHAENDFLPPPFRGNNPIYEASSTKPINEFIQIFHDISLGSGISGTVVNDAGVLKDYLRHRLHFILDSITELPSVIDYSSHKKDLIHHFYCIADQYQTALRVQNRDIEGFKKSVNDSSLYSIKEIKSILTDEDTTIFLADNFKEDAKKFKSSCTLKMSHLQLLDTLLSYVQIAMGQHYVINYLTLKISNNNQISEKNLNELIEDIEFEYNQISKKIKNVMTTASRDFWTCDARIYKDDALYVENQDSSYMELQSLSLYYLKMKVKEGRGGRKVSDCKTIKKYSDPFVESQQDYSFRGCPNGFSKCNELFPSITEDRNKFYKTACLDTNSSAHHRYDQVFETKHHKDHRPVCKWDKIPHQLWAHDSYRNCECLCVERNYYFVDTPVMSNYADDKVVTGARLVVEENFIYIRIQEAKILANGNIDKSTLQWKPIKKPDYLNNLDQTRKHTLEPVDLTEIDVPTGHVVTGLKFDNFIEGKKQRVKLAVLSNVYDHKTGNLDVSQQYINVPIDATVERETGDLDVSTKGSKPNTPISETNQYVAFNVTDFKRDGGQTTIPFIDTQTVESAQPTPLSGAGFYLRGQPGYGGFLAIKLRSYNIEPHVNVGSRNNIV